ncbi:MAG: zinc-binding dehydrogenase [Planctomycetota bacterium]
MASPELVSEIPKRMLAARMVGLKKFEFGDIPVPRPGPRQILVRIERVGVCGSDRGIWAGRHFYNDLYRWQDFGWGEHGHEISGVVMEVGEDVEGIQIGHHVAALPMRGWAQYLAATVSSPGGPPRGLSPVCAPGADLDMICFADPLMVALRHVEAARVYPGDTVAVLGQGFIGLLVTQLLVQQHIRVLATDVREKCLAHAKRFGAETLVAGDPDWIRKITDMGQGQIRSVIECSGADASLYHAGDIVAADGTVVVMGATRKEIKMHYTPLRMKGIDVRFPARGARDWWGPAVRILADGGVEAASLIDHRAPLDKLQETFENWDPGWIKVVVHPHGVT